jgi:hypothetical protein
MLWGFSGGALRQGCLGVARGAIFLKKGLETLILCEIIVANLYCANAIDSIK